MRLGGQPKSAIDAPLPSLTQAVSRRLQMWQISAGKHDGQGSQLILAMVVVVVAVVVVACRVGYVGELGVGRDQTRPRAEAAQRFEPRPPL
jgi:hypothetical protein